MNPRSIRAGALAGAGLMLFYAVVVAGASGSWAHFTAQARQDWYFVALIVGGFGTQICLMSELRRRHRLHHGVAAASGAGAGASTAGMVACCAHHLAELAPFLGATGAAAFLIDYRIPFMVVGIGVNAVGVTVGVRKLGRTPMVRAQEEVESCAAA